MAFMMLSALMLSQSEPIRQTLKSCYPELRSSLIPYFTGVWCEGRKHLTQSSPLVTANLTSHSQTNQVSGSAPGPPGLHKASHYSTAWNKKYSKHATPIETNINRNFTKLHGYQELRSLIDYVIYHVMNFCEERCVWRHDVTKPS